MSETETLVQARGLSKLYRGAGPEAAALRDVSLEIGRGEFTALVGPSGSGKTTLLNLIGALDRPDGGELSVGGQPLGKLSRNALADLRLRSIGFVFQSHNLIPVLSALENVEYVLMLQGVPAKQRRERATRALEAVGLGELLHRRPAQMSGGQQQRVAIARAIVGEPLLVLADEPTASVDSATGAALMDLMAELNQRLGTTFVLATHDPMVMGRARRVVRMRDGRIEEGGS